MTVLIVYESMYGNTESIAWAIAGGMDRAHAWAASLAADLRTVGKDSR